MKATSLLKYFKNGARDFCYTNLEGIDLSFADLRGINFLKSDLDFADFKKANLENANFKNTTLKGTNFEGANLTNTVLDPMNIPNGITDKFETDNGWCVGYRTRNSPIMGSNIYRVGEWYTAPIFSTGSTACHPGLYVFPTTGKVLDFTGRNCAIVSVIFRSWDCHKAGNKYRVREFLVWEDIKNKYY